MDGAYILLIIGVIGMLFVNATEDNQPTKVCTHWESNGMWGSMRDADCTSWHYE